jgi:hypothetical protein
MKRAVFIYVLLIFQMNYAQLTDITSSKYYPAAKVTGLQTSQD